MLKKIMKVSFITAKDSENKLLKTNFKYGKLMKTRKNKFKKVEINERIFFFVTLM